MHRRIDNGVRVLLWEILAALEILITANSPPHAAACLEN